MIRDPLDLFVADFGTPVILHLPGGDVSLLGIHDEGCLNQALGEIDMDTTSKRVMCNALAAAGAKREMELTIIDKRYGITRVQPDGTGFVVLYLTSEETE